MRLNNRYKTFFHETNIWNLEIQSILLSLQFVAVTLPTIATAVVRISGPPRLNFCFTTLPAGTFVLRPSPFKLLLYGPPHFRVILFYGPPLGIWSPPRRLINDNPLRGGEKKFDEV